MSERKANVALVRSYFDIMVYPAEPDTVETEASRYDLLRSQVDFFDEHLRGIRR